MGCGWKKMVFLKCTKLSSKSQEQSKKTYNSVKCWKTKWLGLRNRKNRKKREKKREKFKKKKENKEEKKVMKVWNQNKKRRNKKRYKKFLKRKKKKWTRFFIHYQGSMIHTFLMRKLARSSTSDSCLLKPSSMSLMLTNLEISSSPMQEHQNN